MANNKSSSKFLYFALGEWCSEDTAKLISFRRIFSQGVRYFLPLKIKVRQKIRDVKENNILQIATIFN
jgi:hypothetical protein